MTKPPTPKTKLMASIRAEKPHRPRPPMSPELTVVATTMDQALLRRLDRAVTRQRKLMPGWTRAAALRQAVMAYLTIDEGRIQVERLAATFPPAKLAP